MIFPTVLEAIQAERYRQSLQWGGPEHDDEHAPLEWLGFIQKQVNRMAEDSGFSAEMRIIKIAALAIAALECCERAKERGIPWTGSDSI